MKWFQKKSEAVIFDLSDIWCQLFSSLTLDQFGVTAETHYFFKVLNIQYLQQ